MFEDILLVMAGGNKELDYWHLMRKARDAAKLLQLCPPTRGHRPQGMWSKDRSSAAER